MANVANKITVTDSTEERPAGHTPGPWAWLLAADAKDGVMQWGECPIICDALFPVYPLNSEDELRPAVMLAPADRFNGGDGYFNIHQADRDLIAAAPDLLAALQSILNTTPRMVMDGAARVGDPNATGFNVHMIARKAIAKATAR